MNVSTGWLSDPVVVLKTPGTTRTFRAVHSPAVRVRSIRQQIHTARTLETNHGGKHSGSSTCRYGSNRNGSSEHLLTPRAPLAAEHPLGLRIQQRPATQGGMHFSSAETKTSSTRGDMSASLETKDLVYNTFLPDKMVASKIKFPILPWKGRPIPPPPPPGRQTPCCMLHQTKRGCPLGSTCLLRHAETRMAPQVRKVNQETQRIDNFTKIETTAHLIIRSAAADALQCPPEVRTAKNFWHETARYLRGDETVKKKDTNTPSAKELADSFVSDAMQAISSAQMNTEQQSGCAGSMKQAERWLSSAIQVLPENAQAYSLRAMCLALRGQLQAALQDIRKAISIDSKQASYHSHHGCFLMAVQEDTAAEEAFERALALDPKCADAHKKLSLLFLRKGMHDKAFDSLTHAVQLDPTFRPNLAQHYDNIHSRGL